MKDLSPIQTEVIKAMEPGKWYKASDLPRATGHTYRALERRGLIELREYYRPRVYTPLIWTHEFKLVAVQRSEMCMLCQAYNKIDRATGPENNPCFSACPNRPYEHRKGKTVSITCKNFSHISSMRIK